ncbi:MAG: ferredoxin [Nanoarchaeota archaeon]|nr:ferredoxin [Nanoarchaeota archaeon]
MIKISIDKAKCIGCGACEAVCDKTFGLKDNIAFVKQQPKALTCEKEASDSCPVNAISIK